MKLIIRVAVGLSVLLAMAGCTGGHPTTDPTPTAPSTGGTLGSMAAFQSFSGMTIPAAAKDVAVTVTMDHDKPAYRVKFSLPTEQVDTFCTDGQLSRPLRVTTIPASVRQRFDYQGDSSTGVRVAEASLPSNVSIQREVFALGTKTATSQVQVYAYEMPH